MFNQGGYGGNYPGGGARPSMNQSSYNRPTDQQAPGYQSNYNTSLGSPTAGGYSGVSTSPRGYQQQYAATSPSNTNLQADLARYQHQLQEATMRISGLESQLSSSDSDRSQLLREMENLRAQSYNDSQDKEELIRQVQARQVDSDSLYRQIEELNALRARQDSTIDQLTSDKDQLVQEQQQMLDRIRDADYQSDSKSREIENLKAELSTMSQALSEKVEQTEALTKFEQEYDFKVREVLAQKDSHIEELEDLNRQEQLHNHELEDLVKAREAEIFHLKNQPQQQFMDPSTNMMSPVLSQSSINSMRQDLQAKDSEIQTLRERIALFTAGFSNQDALRRLDYLERTLQSRVKELADTKTELSRFLSDAEQLFQENAYLRKTSGIPPEQLLDFSNMQLHQSITRGQAGVHRAIDYTPSVPPPTSPQATVSSGHTGVSPSNIAAIEMKQRKWDDEKTLLNHRINELTHQLTQQQQQSSSSAALNAVPHSALHSSSSAAATVGSVLPVGAGSIVASVAELESLKEQNKKLSRMLEDSKDRIHEMQQDSSAKKGNTSDLSDSLKKKLTDLEIENVSLKAKVQATEALVSKQATSRTSEESGASASAPQGNKPYAMPRFPGYPSAGFSPALNSAVMVPKKEDTVPVLCAKLAEALNDVRTSRYEMKRVLEENVKLTETLDFAAAKYSALLEKIPSASGSGPTDQPKLITGWIDNNNRTISQSSNQSNEVVAMKDEERVKLGANERLALAEGNELKLTRDLAFSRDEFDVMKRAYEGLEIEAIERETFLRRRIHSLGKFRREATVAVTEALKRLEDVVPRCDYETLNQQLEDAVKKLQAVEKTVGAEHPSTLPSHQKGSLSGRGPFNAMRSPSHVVSNVGQSEEGNSKVAKSSGNLYSQEVASLKKECSELKRILARRSTELHAAEKLVAFFKANRSNAPDIEIAGAFWTGEKERSLDAAQEEVESLRAEILAMQEELHRSTSLSTSSGHKTPGSEVSSAIADAAHVSQVAASSVVVERLKQTFKAEKEALEAEYESKLMMQKSELVRDHQLELVKQLDMAYNKSSETIRAKSAEIDLLKQTAEKDRLMLVSEQRRESEELKREVNESKRELSDLRRENNDLKRKLDTQPTSNDGSVLQKQLEETRELRYKLDEAQTQILSLKRQIDVDIKFELESEKLLVTHLQEEKRDLQDKLDHLTKTLERSQPDQFSQPSSATESEIAKLSVALKLKDEDMNQLQIQSKETQKELLAMKNKALELEFDKVSLEGKLVKLQSMIDGSNGSNGQVVGSAVGSAAGLARPPSAKNNEAVYELEKLILTLRQENKKLQAEITKLNDKAKTSATAVPKPTSAPDRRTQEVMAANATLSKQLEEAAKQHQLDAEAIKEAGKVLVSVDLLKKQYEVLKRENVRLKKDVESLNDEQFWTDLDRLQTKNKAMSDALKQLAPEVLQVIEQQQN